MSKTTFEDYKNAIWREFEIIKKNDVTGFFSDLSPAAVRDYYIQLIDKGVSKADEEIMRLFFETKENESLKKSVNNSNTDKFKPIISFLTGKTKNPDKKVRVELAAILISFEQRPHHIFSKIGIDKDYSDCKIEPKTESVIEKPKESLQNNQDSRLQNLSFSNVSKHEYVANSKQSIKKTILILGLLLISFFTISLFYNYLRHKDCLEWKNDRYIEVDCETKENGSVNLNILYDESLLKRRKITPTDTTTYFKNGKAVIWYCKGSNGDLEFFNFSGYHPVTGKPLHHITDYIIEKYIEK
ncbi:MULTISPECIES: hypothetical protein [Flavobacterium]|uniref:Uncharacterized protein n=1 Tax=Flavobacterium hankyongi TaxID=1176532 RepID=A0ABP9A025_9FLAO|nr:hypothetical protein [Flavobacterium sp. N1846]